MKEPVRWRNPDSNAPQGLRQLMQHARPVRDMTQAEKARILSNVVQLSAMPVVVSPVFVTKKLLAWVLGLGGVMGVLVGATAYMYWNADEPQEPAQSIDASAE